MNISASATRTDIAKVTACVPNYSVAVIRKYQAATGRAIAVPSRDTRMLY